MRSAALLAALLVTTAGAAFVGPLGDADCGYDDSHPGIVAENHWADDRTLPPVWACRYFTAGGDVWAHEQYGALYRAAAIAVVLALLLVRFRRRPPAWLQGLVIAWLTIATFGAFASFDLVAAWGAPPLVVVPCIAFDLWRPIPGVVRWWWAGGIAVVAWAATLLSSGLWGDNGSVWPGLAFGALLGYIAPGRAKYPPEP